MKDLWSISFYIFYPKLRHDASKIEIFRGLIKERKRSYKKREKNKEREKRISKKDVKDLWSILFYIFGIVKSCHDISKFGIFGYLINEMKQ